MYNVQGYGVLYINTVCLLIWEGWHFTDMWKSFACRMISPRGVYNVQKIQYKTQAYTYLLSTNCAEPFKELIQQILLQQNYTTFQQKKTYID
jgi:hypothetical protein